MKIIFFHRWVGVHGGGTETHLLELAKRFSNLGHEITILTRQGQRLHDLDKRIRVIRISRNPLESNHSYDDPRVYLHTAIYMLKSLFKLLSLKAKGDGFDIMSVHFTTEAVIARIFRFLTGTPFIFVLEGYTPHEAMTCRYADLRIAISRFEAGVYKEKHAIDSQVINIGVDLNRFTVDKDKAMQTRARLLGNFQIIALTVCRLETRKDLFTLIEAAKIVNSLNAKVKFIICGEGILSEVLKKKIKAENLDSFINLAGFVSDNKLPYYYAAADMFVLTSKEEWFGIVFLEAMASGLPIITTNVDACPEVIDGCGLFFENGDYLTLAKRIVELSNNPALRNSLSVKSLNRAKEFSWNKQSLLYEQLYSSVLKGRNV